MLKRLALKYWPLVFLLLFIGAILCISRYAEVRKAEQPNDAQASTPTPQTAVIPNDASKSKAVADRSRHHPDWIDTFAWPEGATVWALLLTLIVIAWQSAETRAAAIATEKSVILATEAAKQSTLEMQLEQRAWVGVSAALMGKFAPNERVRAVLWVKNTGKTFALHATLFQRIISLYGPLKEFPEVITHETGITLLPGAEFAAQVEGGSTPLSQDEFNAIQTGKAFVYMFGTIRYRDVMKNSHFTQFSLVYSPAQESFQAYQGHNEAD